MITKKTFTEHCQVHNYGSHTKVLYYDWLAGYSKKAGSFAGNKVAIAAQFITKRELINIAYDSIVRGEDVFHDAWMGFRVAATDSERFKYQIAFNSNFFNGQSEMQKLTDPEPSEECKEKEELDPNRVDDLPF